MTPSPSRNDPAGAAYLDLRKLARADGRPTDELIQLYALEGFLGRLAASPHNESLVLKGGVLLAAFDIRRPTRDIDFAAVTIDGDAEHIRQVVYDVLAVKQDDGLTFDIPRTAVEPIRDDELYPCVRAMIRATLATAKIRFHIDVNIGDPLWPKPRRLPSPGSSAVTRSRSLATRSNSYSLRRLSPRSNAAPPTHAGATLSTSHALPRNPSTSPLFAGRSPSSLDIATPTLRRFAMYWQATIRSHNHDGPHGEPTKASTIRQRRSPICSPWSWPSQIAISMRRSQRQSCEVGEVTSSPAEPQVIRTTLMRLRRQLGTHIDPM